VIFGRRGKLCREFDEVFRDLDRASAEGSAMVRNFRFDDRVSERRERFLVDYVRRARAKDPSLKLPDAFRRYFNEKIRYTVNPRFLHAENGINSMRKFAPEGVKLFRVIELSGLLSLFRRWETLNPLFQGAPLEKVTKTRRLRRDRAGWMRYGQNNDVVEWFQRRLSGGDPNSGQVFLRAILDGLNRQVSAANPDDSFHPAWATVAHDIEDFAASDPHKLIGLLGLHFECLPTWIMTISYPAKVVGTLVRPTVLDGASYCHFPSPKALDPAGGGHPMSLDADRTGGDKLPPEILHRNVRLKNQETKLAWFRIEQHPRKALHDRRRHHLSVLEAHYDPPININRWMPECASNRWP
jgi:hypothetical protein